MTPKSSPMDPEQGALWTTQEAHFLTSDQRGAETDLYKRAEAMTRLMSMLNEDNRAYGLGIASQQEPHRHNIEQRYGSGAPRVVEAAQRKADDRLIAEKYHFATATGMNTLISAGFNKEEVQRMTNNMFDEFLGEYGVGQADAKKRHSAARQIQRSAEKITGRKISRK